LQQQLLRTARYSLECSLPFKFNIGQLEANDSATTRHLNDTKEALRTLEEILSTPNLATVPELLPYMDKILDVIKYEMVQILCMFLCV
jgi:hypothetical protein